jgi:Arc/MetJ-type ribon-helix-helix transcriptional regulator
MNDELKDMVYIRLDENLKRAIEDYRKEFDEIPNRSEAIRRLILAGLNAPRQS